MTETYKTYRKACFLKILTVTYIRLSQGASAQSLTNQTNLFIPQELDIHLDGDFVNEGFIQNQGNLFVSGDWSNTNIYQGNGSIILNGLLPQQFFNNRNAVNNFIVDGIGSKTLVGLLPVTSQLGLSLGTVNVSDADTLLLAGSAVVAGGSSESYIEGALTYAGVGFKFFPVGKNGSYYPVELLNISGINPVTEIEVFDDISSVRLPAAVTRFSDVYWQQKNISGVFNGSPISLGYPIPDDYTNRHVIDILQSNGGSEFSSLGDASVEYSPGLDKVISENNSAGGLFVLGESIPVTGIPGEFYLPTSLSPRAANTDNQFIKVFGNQLADTNFQFLVYNRWGLMVFETTSLTRMITTGWDGKHKGEYLPTGSYPFILKATKINGEVVEKKGMISIIN